MTPFVETSQEELAVGDKAALARSALRLGDLQASGTASRLASNDGGDVRATAIWDVYFAGEACRRLPRTTGVANFHTGWPGMRTLRLGRYPHRDFRCRDAFDGAASGGAEPTAAQVQARIAAFAATLDPQWTIVLTRVINEVPDPDGLVGALLDTRRNGGGLVLTGMGCPSPPFVFNNQLRLGLPDWRMVRGWGKRRVPLLSALASTTVSESWPHHIPFGIAFAS